MNKLITRLVASLAVLLTVGCGQPSSAPPAASHDEPAAATAHENEDKHDGWWCDEHGVPEEICAQCNSKVAADFQKKGDWCQEHDRPDSQCFTCHPELEGKFAARYDAKYGKQPPKPEG